ncbi:hypothetical protein AALP_AA6G299800 [Arabis alpina]|uniref:Uncharacterized protein n=1 Tax=Arabis alpina TaxID=50452 RepID=A0A087GSN1_ARAAL|nr:hypothetical protein AALP_AA6G299800 [Arabis alpina]
MSTSMDPEDMMGSNGRPDDPRSSVHSRQNNPRSSGSLLHLNEDRGLTCACTEEVRSLVLDIMDPRTSCSPADPQTHPETEGPTSPSRTDDPMWMRIGDGGTDVDGVIGTDSDRVVGTDVDGLGTRHADDTRVSDDEDTLDEVQHTKKAKKKAKVKVRPIPPGSSLSDEKSLQRLWRKCGISEEIVECGVDISTDHLSCLTDFRVRGRSEELKHTVTNASGMALIARFPIKDDHFEDRFFFVVISEKTVEAYCIDLVKTRWERRVKPSFPKDSKEFVTAMHDELSSGNNNWRKSFSRKWIERALSTAIIPGKILGRGRARVSSREQAALETTAKAKGSSGELTEFRRLSAERAHISSCKGKGVDREIPSKRQRVDTCPAAVAGRESSTSHVVVPFVGGLLCDEAYSAVMSKASEHSLFFDCLVGDDDEGVRSKDSELRATKEANVVLQSRLDEFAERNKVIERDALSVQKIKKDCDDKLTKLKSRCTKAEGEVVQQRGELSSASDLQRIRIREAVAEARDEIACGFAGRTNEVAGLLAEIGRKVQNDVLNLAKIDANLEF